MTSTGQDIVEQILTLIEDNITDINSDRKNLGKKWVYDDFPRLDLEQYPRIGIENPTTISERHELGNSDIRSQHSIEIQIHIRKDDNFYIGDTKYRDLQALSYLTTKVINLIKLSSTRTTLLSNDEAWDIKLETENTQLAGSIYIKQLVYQITNKR